jgi:hypothetical protein
MAITNTDAALWYNVGIFGELGYAVPNWSNDEGSLNPSIIDFVDITGRNLFAIMHSATGDTDMRTPPSINTLRRIHRLYIRAGQILAGRAIAPGIPDMEPRHVQPGGEFFKLYPVPYFKVRNTYMRRWCGLILMSLAESMQHTENRKPIEISTTFAGEVGQYLVRVYRSMAIECFGITQEAASAPNFLLTDEQLAAYNPAQWFTSTEMVDTVPDLSHVFTEDSLETIGNGILTCHMPKLTPYPTNLTSYYAANHQTGDPEQHTSPGGANAAANGSMIPPAPQP